MTRMNSARTPPPVPGLTSAMLNPYPYTEWYNILRVEQDKWVLVDHYRTVGTVGYDVDIMNALGYMPIANQLLTPAEAMPKLQRRRRQAGLSLTDLDLDNIMKDLDL